MPSKKDCHVCKRRSFAYVIITLEIDGGETPLFAPVKANVKNDGGKRAGFAHVNLRSSAGTGVL